MNFFINTCEYCGREIQEGARNCPYCGRPTVGVQPQRKVVYVKRKQPVDRQNNIGATGFILAIFAMIAQFLMFVHVAFLIIAMCIAEAGLVLSIIGTARRRRYTSLNALATSGLVMNIINIVTEIVLFSVWYIKVLAMFL